jgi:fused-like protein
LEKVSFFSILSYLKLSDLSESVKWPKPISPDMRSFLEGLLTKDSTQRLTWPDLLQHPFVRTGVKGKK